MPESFGPLFDVALAEATRDRGMALALGAEPSENRIFDAIYACTLIYQEFTSDEVWLVMGGPLVVIEHVNAIGGAFNKAALQGIIQSSGRVRKSARPSAHRRNLVIWESRLYKAEGPNAGA